MADIATVVAELVRTEGEWEWDPVRNGVVYTAGERISQEEEEADEEEESEVEVEVQRQLLTVPMVEDALRGEAG
ncbi:hypothetical protein EPUS_05240 [Endocarpon pusillum Z07020]|uniref:Uncharacterized protein n=1 Tax=Endocarpon pusillum (strain Z07020 / HMAS-L-300199) TaxID=1263415 RepID=U1HH54_ENDPU|nr:uncharacterized protein EPUS_05240 [Endocarpon pusillum Z07020]ERF68159.1 hypothetical protein EPUS_05240 [Endocarpon pusillum Z07020]